MFAAGDFLSSLAQEGRCSYGDPVYYVRQLLEILVRSIRNSLHLSTVHQDDSQHKWSPLYLFHGSVLQ